MVAELALLARARPNTLGSKRSTTGVGTCTSGRYSSGGCLKRDADPRSSRQTQERMSGHPGLLTKVSPMSPTAQRRTVMKPNARAIALFSLFLSRLLWATHKDTDRCQQIAAASAQTIHPSRCA